MVYADWIAIAIVVVLLALGAILGFGRLLKFFTSGIFGIIISVFVCYCIGGMLMDIGFVGDLLAKFASLWNESSNGFLQFLTTIHFEVVVYYIVLFIVIQIIRIIIVKILKNIFEIKFIVMKVINKVFGAVLMLAIGAIIALFIFQIIYWVGGDTAESLSDALSGSVFRLDVLFEHNPMNYLVNLSQKVVEEEEPLTDAVFAILSGITAV